MVKSTDPVLRGSAIERIKTDKKTLKRLSLTELKNLTEHPNPIVRKAAENALQEQTKQRNLTELKNLTEHPDAYIREIAAKELSQIYAKQKNLTGLTQLAENPDWVVRKAAAKALEQIGEKGLPTLRELIKDPSAFVCETAANSIAQIYRKQRNLTELKNLTEHPNPIVRKAAENALEQIKTRMAMLGTRRPFAATAHLLEILERTETLKAVSSQLKREFGEEFTGIVVFGSLAKGYARPESDIDYGVIASTPKPVKRFRELAREKGLPLCDEHYVNSGEKSSKTTAMLFNGLFFGDRKALKKSQRAAFIRIESPQEWNRVRRQIFKNETHLETAFKRLGITSKREQQRLKAAAALRVPPPYNEMKKLLGIK